MVSIPFFLPAVSFFVKVQRSILSNSKLKYDQTDQQTAIDAAAGWDGDTYTLWVDNADHRVLAESSLWAGEAEALQFAAAFTASMERHGQPGQPYPNQNATLWEGESGATLLSRAGQRAVVIIAPDRATLDRVRQQFTGF